MCLCPCPCPCPCPCVRGSDACIGGYDVKSSVQTNFYTCQVPNPTHPKILIPNPTKILMLNFPPKSSLHTPPHAPPHTPPHIPPHTHPHTPLCFAFSVRVCNTSFCMGDCYAGTLLVSPYPRAHTARATSAQVGACTFVCSCLSEPGCETGFGVLMSFLSFCCLGVRQVLVS
jgi:hypothetical protein